MSFTPYLDRYLEGLQALPAEVRRNFMLMRNIDIRNQDLAKTIDKYTSDYLEDNMTASPEVKKVKMTEIQEMFDKAKEYSDDKVQLAIQTYEFVDKHIRKLDADLARLEIDQQERSFGKSLSNEETTIKKKRGRKKACEKEKAAASGAVGTACSVQGRKIKRVVSGKSSVGGAKGVPAAFASVSLVPPLIHPTDSIDMPVDPNEPTYCLCNQVSYGEMIGCDNSDCPIEWFHFPCVNLTTKPKGKWYCPRCSLDRKKK